MDDLYDEFGDYIGPDLPGDDKFSDESQNGDEDGEEYKGKNEENESEQIVPNLNEKYAIVLHEDKNYYPSTDEIYPGVEVIVNEEDAQPITVPIIAPLIKKEFDVVEMKELDTSFSFDFLAGMTMKPELIRNVAFAGSLHHGKTTLIDMFVCETHKDKFSLSKELKYTDCREDEQIRGISIKAKPLSLILQNSSEKSLLVNIIDTPGHPNFSDEISAAFRLSDGVVIVVDSVEGVCLHTEKIIKLAIKESLDIILCINKIDRLVLELKLTPNDAYHKIKFIIDEFNQVIEKNLTFSSSLKKAKFVSPTTKNVIFSSSSYGILFSLESFARKYSDLHSDFLTADKNVGNVASKLESMNLHFDKNGIKSATKTIENRQEEATKNKLDYKTFAKFLWGDLFFDKKSRKFSKKPSEGCSTRSFVEFILEPLYKIMGYTLSEEKPRLESILQSLGIYLKNSEFKLDPKPLLKLVCSKYFGHVCSFVDMVSDSVVNSKEGAKIKVEQNYTGDRNTEAFASLSKCDSNEILIINVLKLYHKYDFLSFDSFGRVLSGTVKKGDVVKVMGEMYNKIEQEDKDVKEITNMWIYESRYKVEIDKIQAGNWILLEGVDFSISKTATITHAKKDPLNQQVEIFRPLEFINENYFKVSVEPLNPSELPKMLDGLRKINKSYTMAATKTEDSGEHIIIGTGELYMDCILHDIRKLYSEIEIKVSEPVVTFSETVIDTSSIKCYAETPNKKNRISMTCEPLDKNLNLDIEAGIVNGTYDTSFVAEYLEKNYNWDILTSRSIWSFGHTKAGTNILIDYSLPTETDKKALNSVKDYIVQGFDMACKEGPLCEEPIRNSKFKILDASIASEAIFRLGGQVIPTARRVCYSAFLLASPRIMEPMLVTEIMCPMDCIQAIYTILARRRGHVNYEVPKPGTPFYIINANIPALDSFGFETDLRSHTAGQAFCLSWFDHWSVMPGDPLDRSIVFKPLEPSPPPHLAREAMIKTRRRKGLLEDVTISKFFDDPMLLEVVKREDDFKSYFN